MQTSDVSLQELRRLATLEAPDGARVLSFYLNLDPHANLHVHENRKSAVHSLTDEAARAVEGEEGLGHDALVALREDVSRTRTALEENLDDGWAEGAHALALFVCGPADLFEVLHLPRPVRSRVTIAERPAIEPLAEVGAAQRWAVLLLDGEDARLLEGNGDRLEIAKTATGDRRDVAEMLRRCDEERHYEQIFVGTNERLFGELCGLLPQDVRERVHGRFDAGADWENVQNVRSRIDPLLLADETHAEREALDRLAVKGVRGIGAVLEPLYERRVATLLIEPGLEHRGFVCPKCRWATADERDACPVDAEPMVEHPDLVEWAVELAVEGHAEIRAVRRHDDLADHGGIAVVLRF